MPPRQTNLALLLLLVVALATGTLAFGIGSGAGRWVVVAHGAVGVGLVVLAPWKQTIVRRGLRKPPTSGRRGAVLLTATIVVALLAGFAHSFGLVAVPGGMTTMQIHVGAALAAVAPATWHLITRWVRPRRSDVSRRTLVRAAGLTAVAGAGLAMTEGTQRLLELPGADRRQTGSHERGTDHPAAMPVTQWLFDSVPRIDGARWRLTVRVRNEPPRNLDMPTLHRLPTRTRRVLLDCTGGWYATQDWAGVPVSELLPDMKAVGRNVAGRLIVRSVTGYWRAFPLRDLPHLLLAYEAAGEPLHAGHGFPLRLVAPNRRGFWWVKWVTELQIDDTPWWRQPPFPLQ